MSATVIAPTELGVYVVHLQLGGAISNS
jgi:hypothetical protein